MHFPTLIIAVLTAAAQPILASPTPATTLESREDITARAPNPAPSFVRLPDTVKPAVRRRGDRRLPDVANSAAEKRADFRLPGALQPRGDCRLPDIASASLEAERRGDHRLPRGDRRLPDVAA